jgi:hypothetical protein
LFRTRDSIFVSLSSHGIQPVSKLKDKSKVSSEVSRPKDGEIVLVKPFEFRLRADKFVRIERSDGSGPYNKLFPTSNRIKELKLDNEGGSCPSKLYPYKCIEMIVRLK